MIEAFAMQIGHHTEIRVAGDEPRCRVHFQNLETFGQGLGPREFSRFRCIGHRRGLRRGSPQTRKVGAFGRRAQLTSAHRESGPITCTAAEFAAQRFDRGRPLLATVVFGEHADNESRRAIAALRTATGRHGALYFGHLAASLPGLPPVTNFLACSRRQWPYQAAVDGQVSRTRAVIFDEEHCVMRRIRLPARSLPWRRSGRNCVDVVEEGGLGCGAFDPYWLAVEGELSNPAWTRPHACIV